MLTSFPLRSVKVEFHIISPIFNCSSLSSRGFFRDSVHEEINSEINSNPGSIYFFRHIHICLTTKDKAKFC